VFCECQGAFFLTDAEVPEVFRAFPVLSGFRAIRGKAPDRRRENRLLELLSFNEKTLTRDLIITLPAAEEELRRHQVPRVRAAKCSKL